LETLNAANAVEFVLNGQSVRAEVTSPQTTLLDFLRDRGLTGAKEGCAEGECGACTVVMVGECAGQTAYRAVNSCLMFLPMAAGHEITTVEALARDGRLADAQEVMAAAGGSQCGYCTPGFVMSLFAEQYRPDRSGPCETDALAGNLCRCTGYRPIRDAAHAVGPAPDDAFRARLAVAPPSLRDVAIQGFSRPTTLLGLMSILLNEPEATIVAGGTDVVVESNLKARRWPHLVSLEAVDELHTFEDTASHVRIGAALPLADIGRLWSSAPAVIREWLTLFASPPIRNRATLGGNLATASPIGDSAPLLMAVDARVLIAGVADGSTPEAAPFIFRSLPVSEFFLDYRRTALSYRELLVAAVIPRPLPESIRFYKVAKRRADDISTVAAAMSIDRDESGRVRRACFAFGGVAATPIRLHQAEHTVIGQIWDEAAVLRVQEVIDRTLKPLSDHRGSAAYRLQVSRSLVEKFWWETRQ
jgi:xanthine dehydrogenase small subunit